MPPAEKSNKGRGRKKKVEVSESASEPITENVEPAERKTRKTKTSRSKILHQENEIESSLFESNRIQNDATMEVDNLITEERNYLNNFLNEFENLEMKIKEIIKDSENEDFSKELIHIIDSLTSLMNSFSRKREFDDDEELKDSIFKILKQISFLLTEFLFHSLKKLRNSISDFFRLLYDKWAEKMNFVCGPLALINIAESSRRPIRKTKVAKLYKERKHFSCIDFSNESSSDLRSKIGDLLKDKEIISIPEGFKFLVFALSSLHSSIINEGAMIIDEFLIALSGTKPTSLLSSLSLLVFESWKQSAVDLRIVWESHFQKWMIRTVLTPLTTATKYATLLSCVLSNKDEDTMEFLCREYPTILYPSFTAANWQVRNNAILVLGQVFPLIELNLPARENDLEMERQLDHINNFLKDNNAVVRCTAVQVACSVLKRVWQIIPVDSSSRLLECLINYSARDLASSDVRKYCCIGFGELLRNPASQAAVGSLLPGLAHLLSDKNQSVRHEAAKVILGIPEVNDSDDDLGRKLFCRLCVESLISETELPAAENGNSKTSTSECSELLKSTFVKSIYDKRNDVKVNSRNFYQTTKNFPHASAIAFQGLATKLISEWDRMRLSGNMIKKLLNHCWDADPKDPNVPGLMAHTAVLISICAQLISGVNPSAQTSEEEESISKQNEFIKNVICDEKLIATILLTDSTTIAVSLAEDDGQKTDDKIQQTNLKESIELLQASLSQFVANCCFVPELIKFEDLKIGLATKLVNFATTDLEESLCWKASIPGLIKRLQLVPVMAPHLLKIMKDEFRNKKRSSQTNDLDSTAALKIISVFVRDKQTLDDLLELPTLNEDCMDILNHIEVHQMASTSILKIFGKLKIRMELKTKQDLSYCTFLFNCLNSNFSSTTFSTDSNSRDLFFISRQIELVDESIDISEPWVIDFFQTLLNHLSLTLGINHIDYSALESGVSVLCSSMEWLVAELSQSLTNNNSNEISWYPLSFYERYYMPIWDAFLRLIEMIVSCRALSVYRTVDLLESLLAISFIGCEINSDYENDLINKNNNFELENENDEVQKPSVSFCEGVLFEHQNSKLKKLLNNLKKKQLNINDAIDRFFPKNENSVLISESKFLSKVGSSRLSLLFQFLTSKSLMSLKVDRNEIRIQNEYRDCSQTDSLNLQSDLCTDTQG